MMKKIEQILDNVQKPGRYIAEETNSIRKDFKGKVSIALAYPDSYEVGMSYLGMRILYHLLNEKEDILCERVFMPWVDMAAELRKHDVKLFSLESKTSICKFDILGFSLSYELTFTNVLEMLSLGAVPVRSAERGGSDPIVIAGGSCACNPEPMSEFFDAFIVGEGEEVILEFIEEYKNVKKQGKTRTETLRALARIPGVYVPSLYEAKYEGSKFMDLVAADEDIPLKIEKRTVNDFENSYYPEKQIVPLVRIVHDRIAIEIMRGCPNRCRFCQASSITRPLRIRSAEKVRQLCVNTYNNTGYERIALLSLSSVNYPYLSELVKSLNEDFRDLGVGLSIPSLRVDEAFYKVPEMLAEVRKAGLTFAPETASDEIRNALGKDIDTNILCKSALRAFQSGWNKLKLYFMVGFPKESNDEIRSIIELARKISLLKKETSKGAAKVKVSVNPFVPKAHTPLQWIGMRSKEHIQSMFKALRSGSTKKIQVECHNINQSMVEACMARGGREMGKVIYAAWEMGAVFDGWTDQFNFDLWQQAFSTSGYDIEAYATRTFLVDDKLPWEHISVGVSKDSLKKELEKSGLYTASSKN